MATQNTGLHVKITAQDSASKVVKNLQSTVIRFVGAVAAAVATISAIGLPVKAAKDFDKAMAGVAKTTGFSARQIEQLSGSLDTMSRSIAVSQTELAGIAEIAGQLGLQTEGVAGVEAFTKTVARASITLGIASENLGAFGAQALNVFNLDSSQLENVFAAVNELSNNSVADARALLDIMLRMGDIAGNTVTEVAALAAWFKNLGVATEVAGTSGVRFFSNMESKAAGFADLMNITQREWINMVKVDAVEAFKAATTALGRLDSATRTSLAKQLLGEGRQLALANKAINESIDGFENLDHLLNLSNKGFKEGTSNIDEYARVSEAFANKWQVFLNVLQSIAIRIGNKLLPVLAKLIAEMEKLLTSPQGDRFFSELGDNIRGVVEGISDFVTGITESGAALERFSAILSGIGITAFALSIRKVGRELGGYLIPKVNSGTKALRGINLDFAKTATSVQKLGTVAVLAGRGIAGLTSRLLSLALGPIGIIATTLLTFSDEIFEVIGTLFGLREGAALERQFALMEAKARKEAKAAIDSYTEYVNKEFKNVNVTGAFQGLGDTTTFDDYVEASATALQNLAEATKATREGIEFTFQQDNAISSFAAEIGVATDEIKKLREENEALQATVANDIYSDSFLRGEDTITRTNNARIHELEKLIDDYKTKVVTLTDAQDKAVTTQGKIQARAETMANQLAATTGEGFALWLEAYSGVLALQQKVTEGEEELVKAEKALAEGEIGTVKWQQLADNVEAAERALLALKAAQGDVATAATAAGGKVAGFDLTKVEFVEAQSVQTVNDLAKAFTALNEAGNLISLEDTTTATKSLLLEQTRLKAANERLQVSFQGLKGPIESVNKTLKGVLDNIQKTVSGIRNSSRTMQASLDEIFRAKGVEAETLIDFSKVDAETEKSLKAISDKYAKLYARETAKLARTGREGQTTAYIDVLKQMEAQEIASVRSKNEFAKGQIEAASALSEVTRLLDDGASVLDEYNAAQATLAKNKAANAYANGAEGARLYSADLSKLLLLQGKVNDSLKVMDAAALEAARSIPNLKEFATDGSLISVTPDLGAKEAVQSAKDEIDRFKQAVITAALESKKPIEQSVKTLAKQITDLESGLTSAIASADQMLKTMVEANPALKEVAVTMTGAWTDAFKEIKGSYEEVKAAISEPLQLTGKELIDTASIQAQLEGPLSVAAQEAGITYAKQFGGGLVETLKSQLIQATVVLQTQQTDVPVRVTPTGFIEKITEDIKSASAADKFTDIVKITPNEQETVKGIQQILTDNPFTITVIPEIESPSDSAVGGQAPGFSTGGPVFGAGTGTSDSILAWLSNREYVMDARTTKTFGMDFFRQLQMIAKNGGKLPGFAAGGPVYSSPMPPAMAAPSMINDLVGALQSGSAEEINLNISGLGARDLHLRGARGDVRGLVDALHEINRGTTR